MSDFSARHENGFLDLGKLISDCPQQLIGGIGLLFI